MSRGIIIRAFLSFVIGGALLLFNSSTCLRAVVDTSSSGKMEYYEGWPHMMDTPIEESLFLSIVDESQWRKLPSFYHADSTGICLDKDGNPRQVLYYGQEGRTQKTLDPNKHTETISFSGGMVESTLSGKDTVAFDGRYSAFFLGENLAGKKRILQVYYLDDRIMRVIDNYCDDDSLWCEVFIRIE